MSIDLEQAEKALSELSAKQDGIIVTLSEFIKLNFQKLEGSGLSRRTIYENLKRKGLELGSFKAFSECWRRNAKTIRQKTPGGCDFLASPEEPQKQGEATVIEKIEGKKRAKKMGQGLRPIRLPDGTELEITETGAKTFKI
ncbi:MAG: hypothetical protein Q4A41_05195 [Bacillota bacterium]|nr:hypothetical protein [Bacillota bacterium]